MYFLYKIPREAKPSYALRQQWRALEDISGKAQKPDDTVPPAPDLSPESTNDLPHKNDRDRWVTIKDGNAMSFGKSNNDQSWATMSLVIAVAAIFTGALGFLYNNISDIKEWKGGISESVKNIYYSVDKLSEKYNRLDDKIHNIETSYAAINTKMDLANQPQKTSKLQ